MRVSFLIFTDHEIKQPRNDFQSPNRETIYPAESIFSSREIKYPGNLMTLR